jgi:peptidyl-prolyl cis-trans isomerase C/peptidyl-prolyl cis-trans isomerase D
MNKINLWFIPFAILAQTTAQASIEAARVNDKVITLDQVTAKIVELERSGAPFNGSKKAVTEDLIKKEAAIQEAKKMKLDQDPAIIDRINNVLFYAVIEKKLGSDFDKISLSDAEAKNWYEKNPEIRTSHIFVALPQDASSEDEKKATAKLNSIITDIKAGKVSFAEAAQKSSEDPSAAMGGDLDYRMKNRLDPAYYRAALKLSRAGDISGIVRTPFGLHLIRMTGKHSWSEMDRQSVKRVIFEEKRQDIVNNYLNNLRQKAKVTINNSVIKD